MEYLCTHSAQIVYNLCRLLDNLKKWRFVVGNAMMYTDNSSKLLYAVKGGPVRTQAIPTIITEI